MNTLTCTFCDKAVASKSARRKHNKLCMENPNNREYNPADFSKDVNKEIFECISDDLPDGAYWAMAGEFGLEPEDFIE